MSSARRRLSLLAERIREQKVIVVDRDGGGWDVALVIDGTYSRGSPEIRAEMVAFWREQARELVQDMQDREDSEVFASVHLLDSDRDEFSRRT